MKHGKQTYVKPVIERVTLQDKALVTFAVCRKAGADGARDVPETCCEIGPQPAMTIDPS